MDNALGYGRRERTPGQRRLDELVKAKTREAIAAFERQRVPGVDYAVSSEVTETGVLVVTWTPRVPEA